MAKRIAGRTVTRTSGTTKTIIRKERPAAARRTPNPVGRSVPPRAARRPVQARSKKAAADVETPASDQDQVDTAPAPEVETVGNVVAEAQRQAADLARAFFATTPTLEQMIAARDELRGKHEAVRGLPQYAHEEALYKAQLDALDDHIAGRA